MEQLFLKGIESLHSVVKGKKILLVKDQAFDFLPIKNSFNSLNLVCFSDFSSNPLYSQVCDGINLFNKEECDLIVAVGGGSTIDVAKCIKLFCKMDATTNYLQQSISVASDIPLVAIPTTAGTGSESTKHAVIYYNGEKQSIKHDSIIPNYVLLDPSTLTTLPIYQKKCTMLDALCQAIESWWSISSTEESISYSKEAITLIKNNWEDYIFNNSFSASEKIMYASNLSGRAINITATTAAHAMSYKITSLYGIPHGHAVAVCFPEVWEYMESHLQNCIDKRGQQYLKEILWEISNMIDLDYFRSMLNKMDIKHPVSNCIEKDLTTLVNSINLTRLKNNPVLIDQKGLKELYLKIIN